MRSARAHSIVRLSGMARGAISAGNWPAVGACAREILKLDRESAEGWYLTALADKAGGKVQDAVKHFSRALRHGPERYDAAIELAWLYQALMRHQDAKKLLEEFERLFQNSPHYLYLAAETWSRLGLHGRALPLYRKAAELQPEAEKLQQGLASCAVLAGEVAEARDIYIQLLERHPDHQRNHFELSRLATAEFDTHIEQMKHVLRTNGLPPDRNIFLYYAIAKELEDLGRWDEAFEYYKLGGDAAAEVARNSGYEVARDLSLIDEILDVCDADWLEAASGKTKFRKRDPVPIFVVGLPRTGTTLTERIIGSHSQVESADETFFLEIAIRRAAGVGAREEMSGAIIRSAAARSPGEIAHGYLNAVRYKLEGRPFFIEKYPFNFLYLGFIARGFPAARIVHLRRHPMDACFAMYKQSFFRMAYTLDDLAEYYLGYDRLFRHWRQHLGDRMVEVQYEALVSDPEPRIRTLLDHLGLPFEQACLDFHLSESPSATASTVQVREKVHTRSVAKWKHFEAQLLPLRDKLEASGIDTG